MKNVLIIIASAMLLFSCNNNHTNEEKANPPVLLSHKNDNASCVYLTKDENNKPVICWCEKDGSGKIFFYISFFDAKKNTFDTTINVRIEQNAIFMEEGMPKVAVKSDGTVIAVYETNAPTKENGWAGFVHYIRSFDKGKTWTQPLCVHQDTASGKTHSYAAIARLSDGEIGACWLDESLGDAKQGRAIKFAKTNGRNGFENEILIDSFACQCCRTAISSDKKGNVSILFRDILPGSVRDIAVSTSSDNGKAFSHAVSFSNDDWVISGCPEDGPSVVNEDDNTYATWFTGGKNKGIYYAELNNKNEVVFKKQISTNGKFIQTCLLPGDESVIAYNENVHATDSIYSKIVVNKIDKNNFFKADVTGNKVHANYPVVCSLDANHIIVAWADNNAIYYRVMDVSKINKPIE
jgi:hypothetical protein